MVQIWGQIWTGTRSNRRLEMAKISRVTTTRPIWRHWCQASRIQGCGMVLNSTGRNRFTTAGRVQIDSGWSWTISNCSRDRAWRRGGTTDITNTRTCHFFVVCLTIFQFKFRSRTFTIGFYSERIYQIRADDLGVQFSFCKDIRGSIFWLGEGMLLYFLKTRLLCVGE